MFKRPETLRVSDEEVAARAKLSFESFYETLPCGQVEVEHDIPTEDDVEVATHWPRCHQVESCKADEGPHLRDDLPPLLPIALHHRSEVLVTNLVTNLVGYEVDGIGIVDPGARDLYDPSRDIGPEDAYVMALPTANRIEDGDR